jgi:hypothetical protein
MHMIKSTLFALLGLASASPLVQRQVAVLTTALTTVNSDLATVDTNVNSFTGTVVQTIELFLVLDDLETDVATTSAAVTTVGSLTIAQSATVFTDLDATTTKLTEVLDDVESKVSSITAAGDASNLATSVRTLQVSSGHEKYCNEHSTNSDLDRVYRSVLRRGVLQYVNPHEDPSKA